MSDLKQATQRLFGSFGDPPIVVTKDLEAGYIHSVVYRYFETAFPEQIGNVAIQVATTRNPTPEGIQPTLPATYTFFRSNAVLA